ncbi:hypothetical protein [Devosia sp.]|uniref:hypothetical protein n=1 Tax=Devosia sp. TaxID=1871048 RepID=UPI00292DB25D|nr:hypothetical protein [Devosia sp.]
MGHDAGTRLGAPHGIGSVVGTAGDRSEQIITFHDDGIFDYRYMATLRMHWELGSVGEIKLSSGDGGVRWAAGTHWWTGCCVWTMARARRVCRRG